jgi:uncharacterized membrane protein
MRTGHEGGRVRAVDLTPSPVVAAGLASLICAGLVSVAVAFTGDLRGFFLIWNLLLAWLPLLFGMLASRPGNSRLSRWIWGMLWLLFFPNAPYIFTDLVHLGSPDEAGFWPKLGIVLLFALTGLVVGYLSLHRMQELVMRHFGVWVSWAVVAVCCLLGSAGVAIGRFLRWNSWDALLQPLRLLQGIGRWFLHLREDQPAAVFLGLFALFLFLGYFMFHAMGRAVRDGQSLSIEAEEPASDGER